MLTREQIEEIQGDAREKGIAIKALLKEKGGVFHRVCPEPVPRTL